MVLDLLVENPPVGDDDDRVEDFLPIFADADKLVGQPRDGIRLPAAGGMLDQILSSGAAPCDIGQQPAHDIELLIAGEQDHSFR